MKALLTYLFFLTSLNGFAYWNENKDAYPEKSGSMHMRPFYEEESGMVPYRRRTHREVHTYRTPRSEQRMAHAPYRHLELRPMTSWRDALSPQRTGNFDRLDPVTSQRSMYGGDGFRFPANTQMSQQESDFYDDSED